MRPFKALIAWIDQPVRSVVYEPTGPWHRAFEEALLQAGLPLARANPLQARRFAQAMGQRAKTDAVDARVLAQMGTALPLRPTEASPPTHRASRNCRWRATRWSRTAPPHGTARSEVAPIPWTG